MITAIIEHVIRFRWIVWGLVGGSSPALAAVAIASSRTTTIPHRGTVQGPPEPIFLVGFDREECR